MGLIGKAKALGKKIGKLNPKTILTKVGKVAHSVIGTADKVLGKMEDVGNKIASIPVVGDTLKGLYKAPLLKGVSAEMLFKGAKTGVGIAKKGEKIAQGMLKRLPDGTIEDIAKRKFNNQPNTNIGNTHLASQRNSAKLMNDVISSSSRNPVVQSRMRNIVRHIQSSDIMNSTPIGQVPRTVRAHTIHNVLGGLG